ncbi:MAG: hypothetical protein KGL39_22115 [Patescibacteria group bacterium]|nr:hypothetical protein [Patescibacteria group bacterium]
MKIKDWDGVLRQRRIDARAPGIVSETFKISAPPEVLARFKRFLRHVEYCAGVGHSCTVAMDIDGDGPESFYVDSPNVKKARGHVKEEREHYVERVHGPYLH